MEKIFHRGSRDYGTFIDNTRLISISGYTLMDQCFKMKELIDSFHSRCKKFKGNILSAKRITKLGDSFFRIKVFTLQISTTKNLKK